MFVEQCVHYKLSKKIVTLNAVHEHKNVYVQLQRYFIIFPYAFPIDRYQIPYISSNSEMQIRLEIGHNLIWNVRHIYRHMEHG